MKLKIIYSLKFQMVKIEYKITLYDNNKNLLLPSDLSLYYNMNVICHIKIINSNICINTFANIYQNKYFQCIEYYKINEKVIFGIILYLNNDDNKDIIKYFTIYYFSKKIFNFYKKKKIYKDNEIFDPLIVNNKYKSIINKINDYKINETLKLKKSYIRYPYSILKRNVIIKEGIWEFRNIYNHYFCFCKGFNCSTSIISQNCKYFFFLSIIDNNRNVYNKTDYLFIDFIFNEFSSDDVYPIFEEMYHQDLPVHYITEKKDIYHKFCTNQINKCLTIIHVNRENYIINGDFLNKYLTLFFKLKQVISGGGIHFNYISNIFYNIEYIIYICVGHGVSYLKRFLYSDFSCYGKKIYDKILIPPSTKLISIVLKYGWDEKNIIKINLPRWDKYNIFNKELTLSNNKSRISNNSIFIMFTWREFKKKKFLSQLYFKNIFQLINNELLNKILNKNNIILYFTLHHKLINYKILFNINKNIKFIQENEISECLLKTRLIISDFSSIIFDIIYQRKPLIIYIPDINDPQIENLYSSDYYRVFQSIRNGTINLENKCFTIEEVVKKIIFYINNSFNLDLNLKKFYDSFELKTGRFTNTLINYLINL